MRRCAETPARRWRRAIRYAAGVWAALACPAFAATAPPDAPQIPAAQPCSVRAVANAGILFNTGGRGVLVDALVRGGIPPYAVPSADERGRLEAAQPPYSDVAAILVTHWHEDHFDAGAVAAHLKSSRTAVLVSSREVVDRVRAVDAGLAAERFRPITPAPGASERVVVSGLPIHVLRIRHNPTRRTPEEHVGFLIEGCRSLLHVGDADPAPDNFTLLGTLPRVDTGVVPFWYVLSASRRSFTETSLKPGTVIGMHIPPDEGPGARRSIPASIQLLLTAGMVVDLGR